MYSQINRISMACILLVALGGVFQTAAADIEANKAVVSRLIEEGFNQGNLDVLDEIVAPEFAHYSAGKMDVQGPEGYKGLVGMLRAAFPDLHITIEDIIAQGDKVTVRQTYTGTQQGMLMGPPDIPPTGKEVVFTGICHYQITDGKLVKGLTEFDQLGMLQQLGVMPAMRESYDWGEQSQVTGDPGDPETNKATVQHMFDEVMVQQNLAVIDELFAADYIMHDLAAPMVVQGPEGFKQWTGAMLEPFFSDGEITADDTIAEGDKVVIRWTWSATHTGEFSGIPATGRRITVTGTSIHRFADGKFVESWACYDSLGMIQQLTTPEWPIAGSWISIVPIPDLGNIIGEWTASPQDLNGTNFTSVMRPAKPEPTVFGSFPDADYQSDHIGQTVKMGLNTYESTLVGYGTKKSELPGMLPEIVYISVIYSKVQLIDENTIAGQGTHAFYLASADVDGDGLPDEGQEPIACLPYMITAKRVGVMPPCVPPPPEPEGE